MKNELIETIEIINGKEVGSRWCSSILPSKEFMIKAAIERERKEEENNKSENNITRFIYYNHSHKLHNYI